MQSQAEVCTANKPPSREINENIARLDDHLARAEDRMSVLTERLSPVLRSIQSAANEAKECVAPDRTQIGERLNYFIARIKRLDDRIADAIETLEL